MGGSSSKDEAETAKLEAEKKAEGAVRTVTEKTYLADEKVRAKISEESFKTGASWYRYLEEKRQLQQEKLQVELERERTEVEKQRLELEEQRMELESQRLALNRIKREEEQIFLKRLIQNLIVPNVELLNQLRQVFHEEPLTGHPTKSYKENILKKKSSQYRKVSRFFENSCKACFNVTQIRQIESPFHVLQFKIMKMKYRKIYQEKPQEYSMFHGTKQEHLDGICQYNFDKSKAVNGMATSFARDSYFATYYPKDKEKCNEKVMVLAKVLVGDTETVQPKYLDQFPTKCYSTINKNGSVIVKFDDASAYPQYIIYYQGMRSK